MIRITRWLGVGGVAVGVAVLACSEKIDAPGACPDYCPVGGIITIDTILPGIITKDSSYGRPIGHINPATALALLARSLPGGVESRPIFTTDSIHTRLVIKPTTTDTTTGQVLQPDSVLVQFTLVRWDTSVHDLVVKLYALPETMDSSTAFGDVATPFGAAALDSVNVDSLIARPGLVDSAAGLRAIVDTTATIGTTHVRHVTVFMRLDSLQLPFVAADTGRVGLGLRVSADSLASVAFGSLEGGSPLQISWYSRLDSAGTIVHNRLQRVGPRFDTFVFDPPTSALDSNLTVGGIPTTRALLRVNLPRHIRDSVQIVRATLELVPAGGGSPAVRGDSSLLFVHPVAADLGAKSPLQTNLPYDSSLVHVGDTATVQIEITNTVRQWQADTLIAPTLLLRQIAISPRAEGTTFAELRFFSTRSARRPVIRLTYIPKFQFGAP